MHNFWVIFKDEYTKRVGKRSFILVSLAVPVMIIVFIAAAILIATSGAGEKPLGYVDQSGLIKGEVSLPRDEKEYSVEILPFTSEEDARRALEAGEIQAYYVIPPDYLKTTTVNRYDWQKSPSPKTQAEFSRFMKVSLASTLPADTQNLLLAGPDLVIRSMDGSREVSNGNVAAILIPLLCGFLFYFSTMTSAGYMLQIVTDEKENRTMEILMTSVTPGQFIGGKALSLMSVALTQLIVWVLVGVVGIAIAAPQVPELQNINIPLDYLLVILVFFLPAFSLVSGMMIAIGSSVSETRQGQQIAGIINLLFILPMFFSVIIFTAPNSPLMVILTLFPTTAFITVSMRWGIVAIPLVQLAASWLLLVFSASFSVWAAIRIFRLGMLNYGQRLSMQSILAALGRRKQPQALQES